MIMHRVGHRENW